MDEEDQTFPRTGGEAGEQGHEQERQHQALRVLGAGAFRGHSPAWNRRLDGFADRRAFRRGL